MLSLAGEFPAAAGSGAINRTRREAPHRREGGKERAGGWRFPALPPPASGAVRAGDASAGGGRAVLTPEIPRGSVGLRRMVRWNTLSMEMKTCF